MADEKKGGDPKKPLQEDQIVKSLMGDANQPPTGLTNFVGLLYRSSKAGHWLLYLTLDMSLCVEIQEDDIVHSEQLPPDKSPFTVSLVLPARSPLSNQTGGAHTKVEPASSSAVAGVTEQALSQPHRTYPPGSEWLFVKLYCPRDLEDDVISGSMLTFGENAIASGLADSWFFIRYSDPDPHLRLRFQGVPERLTRQLFGHV